MRYNDYLKKLVTDYKDNCAVRKNGTMLLGIGKIPNAKHKLFVPLEQRDIDEYLKVFFKYGFPDDLAEILKISNGANLFNIRIYTDKVEFAHVLLCVLGLPRTSPTGRAFDLEEPFDIRVENFARHEEIPDTWIKFAVWTEVENIEKNPTDLFFDCVTNKVYACEKNKKDVLYSWNSVDDCLCSIIEILEKTNEAYKANF